jgi:2',3'-cyclic-nucleotide 2'-phosphodiesterase (5'-nucleotidase family)
MTFAGARTVLAGLAVAACAAAALYLLPRDREPREARVEAEGTVVGSGLDVIFTSEFTCELQPCYCEGRRLGGVGTVAAFIRRRGGAPLVLDTGCMGCGTRPEEVTRLEALLRGMAAAGYDAANVGEFELWLGARQIRRLSELGVQLVSANVLGEGGEPVVAPFVTFRRGGLRIAVTGLVAGDAYRAGPGLSVEEPFESLARLLPAVQGRSDVILVLADVRPGESRRLAEVFPELTAVLFRGRGESAGPVAVNGVTLASVSGLGRYAGTLVLDWKDGAAAPSVSGGPVVIDRRYGRADDVVEASIGWLRAAGVPGSGAPSPAVAPGGER